MTTVSTYLCNAVFDDLLAGQIRFVANEELIHAFGGITINLLEPLLDVGEGVWNEELDGWRNFANGLSRTAVSNVVNYDDTMGTTVVRGRNSSESFLSWSGRQRPSASSFRCFITCSIPLIVRARWCEKHERRDERTRGDHLRFGV